MLRFFITVALIVGLAGPAAAQASPRQTDLAERYLDLVQTDQLGKLMERMIEQSLAADGQMSEEERDFMRRQAPPAMERMMNRFVADLTPIVAETYSEAELEALIRFFDTPLGQSVAAKQIELGVQQQTLIQPAMIEMMTSLMAKYCAEFDCAAAAGKPGG